MYVRRYPNRAIAGLAVQVKDCQCYADPLWWLQLRVSVAHSLTSF